MRMKKVSEFMVPLEVYPHVPYWFSIRQTVAIMQKAEDRSQGSSVGARFVLVFNESYKLLGTVRRRDIFQGLKPGVPPDQDVLSLSRVGEGPAELPSSDSSIGELARLAERPISDLMRPIESTVDHEDLLLQVMSKMVEQNASMLPVLKEDVVVGVVRSADVFQEIASLIL